MNIPPIAYLRYNSKRKFGVELELSNKIPRQTLAQIVAGADPKRAVEQSDHYVGAGCGGVGDYNNSYWHVKFDRSCGDKPRIGGWEVASFVAKGYKDLARIGTVAKALRDGGATVNDHCALHVHSDVVDFDTAAVAAVVARWMMIEDVFCQTVPKHRRDGEYCRMLTKRFKVEDKVYTPATFWSLIHPREFGHAERRVTLNFCNFALGHRRTLELRLPEGTVEPRDVKNWARLFVHFIDTCKGKPFPTEKINSVGLKKTLEVLGLHGDSPFLLLSPGLHETKVWFLKRIVKFTALNPLREEALDWLFRLEAPKSDKPPEKKERVELPTVAVGNPGDFPQETAETIRAAREAVDRKKKRIGDEKIANPPESEYNWEKFFGEYKRGKTGWTNYTW